MKAFSLENHPLNKWLDKADYYNWYKIKDILPSFISYPLNESQQIELLNKTIIFLNSVYEKIAVDINRYSQKEKDNILEHYKQIISYDKKQQSIFFTPYTICLIDSMREGEEFIDSCLPGIFKHKKYRIEGNESLIKYMTSKNFSGNEELLKSFIIYCDHKIKRYNIIPNWGNIIEKYPLLQIALLSQKFNYSLKEKELFIIFENSYYSIKNYCFNIQEKNLQFFCDSYSTLLMNSLFFKNSLAPSKNLKNALCKFLKQPAIDLPKNNIEKFVNNIINFKGFDYLNYEYKLQKDNYYKKTGKYFLKEEEKKIIIESELITKLKKIKI